MKKFKKIEKVSEELEALVCDRCGRETPSLEIEEMQEYLQIDFRAGFGSVVFPDESQVTGDFCQYCVKDLLGNYLKVVDPLASSKDVRNQNLKTGIP